MWAEVPTMAGAAAARGTVLQATANTVEMWFRSNGAAEAAPRIRTPLNQELQPQALCALCPATSAAPVLVRAKHCSKLTPYGTYAYSGCAVRGLDPPGSGVRGRRSSTRHRNRSILAKTLNFVTF